MVQPTSNKKKCESFMLVIGTVILIGVCMFLLATAMSQKAATNLRICDLDPKTPEIQCQCPNGYGKSPTGHCATGYDQRCVTSENCEGLLVCHSGKCGCRFADQIYIPKWKSCVSRVGGPCNSMLSWSCHENSHCRELHNTTNGLCECNWGHKVTHERLCNRTKTINSVCSPSIKCDSMAGLACINGICQCAGLERFNETMGLCLGLVGSPCNAIGQDGVRCIQNATCTKDHPKLPAICNCGEGFRVTAEYTCE